MIRLLQRRLIIPRGDTGSFTVPLLSQGNTDNIAVFTIFDELTRTRLFQKIIQCEGDVMNVVFTHNDTVNLKPGKYLWDIKFYQNPQFVDEELVNGDEVDSYYAGFSLPVCEIRETADNYLVSSDAPNATLSSEQLDVINGIIHDLNEASEEARDAADRAGIIADQISNMELNANDIAFTIASVYDRDTVGQHLKETEDNLFSLEQDVAMLGGNNIPYTMDGDDPSTETIADVVDALSSDLNNLSNTKIDNSAFDNAGITAKSYITVMEETVTTAQDSTHISPYALANTTWNFNKEYMYRVTVNDTEYILPCELWGYIGDNNSWKEYEYIGNLNLYEQDTSGITTDIKNVSFILVNDNVSTNAIEFLTATPGQYAIKLEKIENTQQTIPNSLIYGNNYYPIEYVPAGSSTYSGISIGHNRLKNTRGTVAIGNCNIISNEFSTAIGNGNVITGKNSSVVGVLNTVEGDASYSEGQLNTVTGGISHAEGGQNTVSAAYSHAEGRQINISAQYSHGEGRNNTIGSGSNFSHVEGLSNNANGMACHVEGSANVASGIYSHAEGFMTIANHSTQHVFGQCNIADPSTAAATAHGTYIEIVGNGTADDARSNARTLDWLGNEELAGSLTLGKGTADEVTITATQLKQLLTMLN